VDSYEQLPYNTYVVRIDLAYALNDNQTRSHWSLSILAGQAF
jgi:hypothetical protein